MMIFKIGGIIIIDKNIPIFIYLNTIEFLANGRLVATENRGLNSNRADALLPARVNVSKNPSDAGGSSVFPSPSGKPIIAQKMWGGGGGGIEDS